MLPTLHRTCTLDKQAEGSKRKSYSCTYTNSKTGEKVDDRHLIKLAKRARVPPAYTDVEIHTDPDATRIATATGKNGKKQYFYSKTHTQRQQTIKHCQLMAFTEKMPQIEAEISRHLEQTNLSKNVAISLVLRIIMLCNFRIGSRAKTGTGNVGITTIRKQHVQYQADPDTMTIDFNGKSNQRNTCTFEDPGAIRHLSRLLEEEPHKYNELGDDDAPVFTFHSNGRLRTVSASDVNRFLQKFDKSFTAKMFRTWNVNVLYIQHLVNIQPSLRSMRRRSSSSSRRRSSSSRSLGGGAASNDTPHGRKKVAHHAIQLVAKRMYHTKKVCEESYINAHITDAFINDPTLFASSIMRVCKEQDARQALYEFLRHKCESESES